MTLTPGLVGNVQQCACAYDDYGVSIDLVRALIGLIRLMISVHSFNLKRLYLTLRHTFLAKLDT